MAPLISERNTLQHQLGYLCDILAKSLATFCQCSEAKFKSNGLISLVEEIRRRNIESSAWLLLIFLLQINIENKLVGQENIIQFGEEKRTAKLNKSSAGREAVTNS